jgi:hypothetical protein
MVSNQGLRALRALLAAGLLCSPSLALQTTSHGGLGSLTSAHAPESACFASFGPDGPTFRWSVATNWPQIWSQVSIGPDVHAFAFSTGLEIVARFYDADLLPITGDFQVNTTLTESTQDEPAISVGTTGRVLVAWSDRNGYDGEQMGIFGRVYDGLGNAQGPEIQINQNGAASQWRPLIAPTPTGGWVVAWSGDWDGDAFMRIFDQNGAPLSGDIEINAFPWDAQVDPAVAVDPLGNIFASFVDFSSHDPSASSLNLYGRTFTPDGTPVQAEEFLITSWLGDGIQSEPRVAVDAAGRFLVVFEDALGDGSGKGLFARRFDAQGTPLGVEFPVNSTTNGDQIRCSVAMNPGGDWLCAWEDRSQGTPRVVARRFDAWDLAIGEEFVVDEDALGRTRPVVAAQPDGHGWVIAFDGPVPGFSSDEVWARSYSDHGPRTFCTPKINSQGCEPLVSFTGHASVSDPAPFTITATQVRNSKYGLLFYGVGGGEAPFLGGTLCVGSFLARTPVQFSGGGGGVTCLGTFALDFNAWLQGPAAGTIAPGTTIAAQYYYRDPPDAFGVGLTNGVRFVVCP